MSKHQFQGGSHQVGRNLDDGRQDEVNEDVPGEVDRPHRESVVAHAEEKTISTMIKISLNLDLILSKCFQRRFTLSLEFEQFNWSKIVM